MSRPPPGAGGRGGEYADSFSGEAAAVTGAGDPLRRRVIAQFDRCAGKYVDAERRDALLAGMTFYDGSSEEALDGLLRGAEYELCEACGAEGLGPVLARALTEPTGEASEELAARAAGVNARLSELTKAGG